MTFSVILPTLNENNHIKDLITSISNIFFSQNISFEILVVDDNSTDGTRKTVDEFSKINMKKNTINEIIFHDPISFKYLCLNILFMTSNLNLILLYLAFL